MHISLILRYTGSILLMVFMAGTIASAQTNAGYAGSFLRMGLGARGIGMANAVPAGTRDVFGYYYNPAVLPQLERKEFGTSYGFLPLDRSYNYIGYVMPLPPTAGLGLGWFSTGVDDIQGRDFSGNKIDIYSVRQHTFLVAFGNKFSQYVQIGALLKVMRNDLQEVVSSGVGFDIGLIVRPHPMLELGLVAQNFNAKFSWDTKDVYSQGSVRVNNIPGIYRAGVAVYAAEGLLVNAEYEYSENGAAVYRVAAEYQPISITRVRTGIADGALLFGAGLRYQLFGKTDTAMDYAFVPGQVGEGASHYFSWTVLF